MTYTREKLEKYQANILEQFTQLARQSTYARDCVENRLNKDYFDFADTTATISYEIQNMRNMLDWLESEVKAVEQYEHNLKKEEI